MSDDQLTQDAPEPVLAWGAATHTGMVREENEDAYVAETKVFGVADGMGGHQAGEVASAIAAKILQDRLPNGASVDLMVAAVVEANSAIFQAAHTHAEQRGMGTTLTALALIPVNTPARVVVANVGDSRTYLLRNGRLRRVTVDHSYVQELVNTGHITEAEARSHPRRNIVTRALGIEPTVKVDTWVQPLAAGDRFVLCSDGLVDEVDDDDIARVLDANPDPQSAADALVTVANNNGGRDNVTVIVVDVLDGAVFADFDELDADLEWNDEHESERLIDAESGLVATAAIVHPAVPVDDATEPGQPAAGPATMAMPVIATPEEPRRRSALGTFLFLLTLGIIATLAIVLVLVLKNNQGDEPTPTTVTTISTTSTTVRTTMTLARTTTTTDAPGTTAP